MKLEGKRIFITGASSGLGHGMALALAQRGNDLAVTARREERLRALATEVEALGRRCVVVPADATDQAASAQAFERAVAELGGIDVAILNAGGGRPTNMASASVEDVIGIQRANFDTLVNFLVPAMAHMQGAGGGVIAYTGSPAGYFGLPKSGPYSASKAAGRVLIDSCRIELAPHNVRFVALYPGFTYTDALDPDQVPIRALIIDKERAVREMVWAIERERSHHLFPKRIRVLIGFARMLPEPLRRRILSAAAGSPETGAAQR